MRISKEQINKLQALLEERLSTKYTCEEAQKVGLAIIRSIAVTERRNNKLNIKLTERTESCG